MPIRRYGLSWLGQQASARLRRTQWGDSCGTLADELWTILSRLRDLEAESVEVPGEDGSTNRVELTEDQIDLLVNEVQERVVIEQPPDQDPDGPVFLTRSRTFWDRWSLPCRVDSHVAGKIYNVTLFPFGDMTPLSPSDAPEDTSAGSFDAIDPALTIVTVAQQLFLNPALLGLELIPSGSWVSADLMRQYKAVDTLRDGAVTNTSITLLQQTCYMQVPVWM